MAHPWRFSPLEIPADIRRACMMPDFMKLVCSGGLSEAEPLLDLDDSYDSIHEWSDNKFYWRRRLDLVYTTGPRCFFSG